VENVFCNSKAILPIIVILQLIYFFTRKKLGSPASNLLFIEKCREKHIMKLVDKGD